VKPRKRTGVSQTPAFIVIDGGPWLTVPELLFDMK